MRNYRPDILLIYINIVVVKPRVERVGKCDQANGARELQQLVFEICDFKIGVLQPLGGSLELILVHL